MENPMINPHNELAMPVKRNLPRDFFLHLFAIVTLYWSSVGFITLCWQLLNHFFPDPLTDYYSYGYSGPMTFALASLIIVFPLFLLASWILNKIYSKESQVRESKIRKWLIYVTLFITAIVIIVDLVSTLNTFLNGEITVRFILKALSILLVAGLVFTYYLDDLRQSAPSKLGKMLAWITMALVVVGVITAFFVVGSPHSARSVQFDQIRVNNLQDIQQQVVSFWQVKGEFPASLSDLSDSISGYTAPVDPETQMPYEYTVKDAGNLQFELCATFKLDSNVNGVKSAPVPAYYGGDLSQNWNHTSGHECFVRTIDPQKYPRILPDKAN